MLENLSRNIVGGKIPFSDSLHSTVYLGLLVSGKTSSTASTSIGHLLLKSFRPIASSGHFQWNMGPSTGMKIDSDLEFRQNSAKTKYAESRLN